MTRRSAARRPGRCPAAQGAGRARHPAAARLCPRDRARPRPYRLADLAQAAGMSISGVRTAYTHADIEQAARLTGGCTGGTWRPPSLLARRGRTPLPASVTPLPDQAIPVTRRAEHGLAGRDTARQLAIHAIRSIHA